MLTSDSLKVDNQTAYRASNPHLFADTVFLPPIKALFMENVIRVTVKDYDNVAGVVFGHTDGAGVLVGVEGCILGFFDHSPVSIYSLIVKHL